MRARLSLLVAVLLTLSACANGGLHPTAPHTDTTGPGQSADSATLAGLSLPTDGVQPWEQVDARGFVIPAHGASAFPGSSELTLGRERFAEGGDVSDLGEASRLSSSAGSFSYALYRVPMGGNQPGALSVDVNLRPGAGSEASQYWLGLGDYATDSWDWRGPYSEAQVTLLLDAQGAGADYLSDLGNAFIALAVHDGSAADVVALTVSPLDSGDTTAPPAPAMPTMSRVRGGLELSWAGVLAGDLAGYRMYYNFSPFADISDNGVREAGWLEGTTRALLELPPRLAYVGLTAVDVNGNESALSPVASESATAGDTLQLNLSIDSTSAMLNEPVTLTVSGAERYDFDLNGDGTFEITNTGIATKAVDTSATGLIRPRVRALIPGAGGTNFVALGSVSLIVSGNQRPVANAQANPQIGTAPLAVNFNGTGTDFDGTIAEYAWDFNGDGVYDHNSPADGVTAEQFNDPGLFNAKLRVTDDLGAWDVDTIAIQVLGGVPLTATPNEPQAGEPFTLRAVSPGPATQYLWDLDGDNTFETNSMGEDSIEATLAIPGNYLLGVRITLASGNTAFGYVDVRASGWYFPTPQPDEAVGMQGQESEMALINGNPAIAYQDGASIDLKYVRALDPEGRAWSAPVTVDSAAFSGGTPSIELVNGRPAISYYNASVGDLVYARATNATGTAWGTPVTVDSADNVGLDTSMVVANGRPAIAYRNQTTDELLYVRATDINGTAWGTPVILDSANVTGYYNSMVVVDGNPAIAYQDSTESDLRYIRAADADGAVWNGPLILDLVDETGFHPSLAVINGRPAVAYYSATATDLRFIRALDSTGSAWGFIQVLDSEGTTGQWPSLAVVNGRPAIAYVDRGTGGGNLGLSYVQAVDIDGRGWGYGVQLDSRGYATEITLVDVNGGPGIGYATWDQSESNIDMVYARGY